jgi:hypothetical protein
MIWIIVPILGIGAYFLLTRGPAAPVPGSGGVRYRSYIDQITAAVISYQAATTFDSASKAAASTTAKGTLQIIQQMAQADQVSGALTTTDIANINTAVSQANAQII